MTHYKDLPWKCHTPNLLQEVADNPTTSTLAKPLSIFGNLLWEVATRAQEINDPILNHLMCRLTLYSQADPESPDYDKDAVDAAARLAQQCK
jgi:hypothetical protein